MLKRNKLLLAILAASLTTGLTACGGSSSDNQNNEEQVPPGGDGGDSTIQAGSETGRFVDSAVGGIEYETSAGYNGITNDNGEFKYNGGDEVTFTLGTLNFGTVAAKTFLTPKDLAAGDANKSANIARVLQTLDDDGIPDNGITITAAAREEAAKQNPTDVATADLNTAKNIILDVASKNTAPPTDLVSREQAESHLDETIAAEDKVTSCGTGTTPVTEGQLKGKTFGYIRSGSEINLLTFKDDGKLVEFQNDLGDVRFKDQPIWAVSGGEVTITNTPDSTPEVITACAVGPDGKAPYYILFDGPEGATTFYAAKDYTKSAGGESFVLSTVERSDFSSEPTVAEHDLITIGADLNVNFLSEVATGPSSITTDGALEITAPDGTTDKLYILTAQGSRVGIYLDFDNTDKLIGVSKAAGTSVATTIEADSFSGKAFIDRFEESNEIVILVFNPDGTYADYANDHHPQGTSSQAALVNRGTWEVNSATSTLDQNGDNGTESFRMFESSRALYFLNEKGEGIDRPSKTQAIAADAFVGTYNVNIPTETTVDTELVIGSNGDCSYGDAPSCTWVLKADGRAELDFGKNNVQTRIWQLAGSNDNFAFLITHEGDASDNTIEPGFMTRK